MSGHSLTMSQDSTVSVVSSIEELEARTLDENLGDYAVMAQKTAEIKAVLKRRIPLIHSKESWIANEESIRGNIIAVNYRC